MFRTFVFLAALAVLSSATMPFGFMPARAADGSFILRICDRTMQVPVELADTAKAADGHEHHETSDRSGQSDGHGDHEDGSHEMRCNYAVTATADLPQSPQIQRREPQQVEIEQARLTPLTAIFPANLPPATGPPIA